MALKTDFHYTIEHINERLTGDEQFSNYFSDLKPVIVTEKLIQGAYSRIEFLSGNKEEIKYLLVTYINENCDFELIREEHSFAPDTQNENTPNFYTQAYNHTKTKDEFLNALDC